MSFGQSQANFLKDVPAAPAQVVKTRLLLYLGDWFLSTADGTPWRTQVLGKYTDALRDAAMRSRILGTQGVTSIVTYASQIDRAKRAYTVQAQLDTLYGRTFVNATVPIGTDVDVRQGR